MATRGAALAVLLAIPSDSHGNPPFPAGCAGSVPRRQERYVRTDGIIPGGSPWARSSTSTWQEPSRRRLGGARAPPSLQDSTGPGRRRVHGGVYEIGALRAIDPLATNRTVNQFDIYVGTSAGAFIFSLVANGVTPEEMMRVLNRHLPSPLRDIDLGYAAAPNYLGFLQQSLTFPFKVIRRPARADRDLGEISAVDLATASPRRCPRALLQQRDRALRPRGPLRPRPHQRLPDARARALPGRDRPRYDRAGDPRRGRMGRGPDLEAVAASGALPGIYEPVEINGREFIDGGIASTTNVDVAIERGEVRGRHQPAGPLRQRLRQEHSHRHRLAGAARPDMGIVAIANQTFRLLSHDRLHRAVESGGALPGVDIILIEPELDDELMFGTSILDYRARLQIAKHGFESVTLKAARDYDKYRSIAERHGSRSRPVGSATSSTRSSASARSSPPGAGCSSSPSACCAPRATSRTRGRRAGGGRDGLAGPGRQIRTRFCRLCRRPSRSSATTRISGRRLARRSLGGSPSLNGAAVGPARRLGPTATSRGLPLRRPRPACGR